MRTPSLYSQDDPLATALRPSSTETDVQRRARLAAEAEARRVSEQIDEELRQERERMKRNKGDVKVYFRRPFSTHILILHTDPSPAAPPWSSRERQIDPSEAISTHVQAQFY